MSAKFKMVFIIAILIFIAVVFFIIKREDTEPVDETMATLEQLIAAKKGNVDQLFEMANDYYQKDDLEKAKAVYLELIKINPQENLYKLNLGDIYGNMGKPDDAQDIYMQAIANNKKEMNAYARLVDIYAELNKKDIPENVITNLEELSNMGPYVTETENVISIQLLARIYKIKEEYAKSIIYYQRLVDLDVPTKEEIMALIEELKAKELEKQQPQQ